MVGRDDGLSGRAAPSHLAGMSTPKLTPARLALALWIGLPLLLWGLVAVSSGLEERWRAQPPTDQEETDCRIEAMMGGDNPVEVERIYRACADSANDAYVAPRRTSTRLTLGLLLLAYGGLLALATVRARE